MTITLATRLQKVEASATLALNAKAKQLQQQGREIINLCVGEPDFDTPEHITQAGAQAIKNGKTNYTAADGIVELKQAIIDKFARDNQLAYGLSQVIASSGAKQSLFNACQALLNPGDEVIIPAPYWVSYRDMVYITEATPIMVTADIDQHYKITASQLAAAITHKTRLVMFNSPTNSTGQIYSEQELQAIGEVLLAHPNIIIISDDIYENFIYQDQPFKNIINVCPQLYDRTIIINGVSKSYAMTGWRIGYAAGPEPIIKAMKNLQSQATGNPCSISQYAAVAALNGDQSCVRDMATAFKTRHDLIAARLSTMPNVEFIPSAGAFYAFIKLDAVIAHLDGITNDIDLAGYLLDNSGLAIVPGSAFGLPGAIRISFAASEQALTAAMDKLAEVVNF